MPDDLSGLLITLALNFSWASPAYLDQLYCDARDHYGALYWYDAVVEQDKQYQEKIKKL